MESATIVPKYVNPPRGNAKSGSIKDADGAYWGIPKDKIEHYSAFIGKAIVVSYEMNGEYRNIKVTHTAQRYS